MNKKQFIAILLLFAVALTTPSCFLFRKKNGCNTCPSFKGRH